MGNFLMYSCKEATYLISKKEEGRLTFMQNVKLRLHIGMCKFCTLFEKQNQLITHHAAHTPQEDKKLPAEIKNKISQNLKS